MPSPATTAGLVPTSAFATGARSCTVMTTELGRCRSTVAERIHGSVSSAVTMEPASRWNTFVSGPMPARTMTACGLRIFVPSTRMSRSRNSGVYVAAANAASNNTGSATSATAFAHRAARSGAIAVEPPNEVHLGLELDTGRAPDPLLDQTDERQDIASGGIGTRHDEDGVHRRHRGAPDARSLELRRLDHRRRMPAGRVLEHAPAVGFRERLGASAPCPGTVHRGADRVARSGSERERRGGHDRTLREGRPPVRERGRLR